MQNIKSVSYTHLDVYKRQDYYSVRTDDHLGPTLLIIQKKGIKIFSCSIWEHYISLSALKLLILQVLRHKPCVH